ncbi:AI-2E family transporter [Lapidilactobacillus mulanensis]|uniref:AI-2E family transporter n=1 Tax=Lapidilactobacillus mulanensis TaxID=2485999 RepID=A0ABW4DMV1_9LACO|nr:AI-2E family transporter [Lapidilactobacillus mulanensis]
MINKFKQSKLFFWSIQLLVIVTLIWVLSKISFVLGPVQTFAATLFGPFLFAGFLFYLMNPLINFLEKIKVKRSWGILIAFLLLFGVIIVAMSALIPSLTTQITNIVSNFPQFATDLQKGIQDFLASDWADKYHLDEVVKQLNIEPKTILTNVSKYFSNNVADFGSVVSSIGGIAISAFTVPVILFYFLKDGNKLIPNVQRFFPDRYREEIAELLRQMNQTISTYFSGQFLDMLFVGTLTFIGYLIIQMPYALLLGVFAGILNIVPYLGPWLGVLPALVVALTVSVPKAVAVAIVVIIVQQVDSNLLYPNVIGKTLQIHPLTIIVLLLVAGNMFGFVGIVLAVPGYAVAKTIIKYIVSFYNLRKRARSEAEIVDPDGFIDPNSGDDKK